MKQANPKSYWSYYNVLSKQKVEKKVYLKQKLAIGSKNYLLTPLVNQILETAYGQLIS
jgi:hypothetical protein